MDVLELARLEVEMYKEWFGKEIKAWRELRNKTTTTTTTTTTTASHKKPTFPTALATTSGLWLPSTYY